jgi:hypothetical protein
VVLEVVNQKLQLFVVTCCDCWQEGSSTLSRTSTVSFLVESVLHAHVTHACSCCLCTSKLQWFLQHAQSDRPGGMCHA